VLRKRHKIEVRALTAWRTRTHSDVAPGKFKEETKMTMDNDKPQTRRKFLAAILGGTAAVMLVGAPEDAEAAEERRERRARRRAHREERREERHERRRRRRRRRDRE
jgi:hypothetical protein